MAIMTILASAITVAAIGLMGYAQKKGTMALFERIGQVLEQYKADHRMYVPQDLDETGADSDSASAYPLWQALEHDANYKFAVEAKFKARGDEATDPATGATFRRFYYIDAWKNPIRYECRPPYTRFELRSAGKDAVLNNEDDIILE